MKLAISVQFSEAKIDIFMCVCVSFNGILEPVEKYTTILKVQVLLLPPNMIWPKYRI